MSERPILSITFMTPGKKKTLAMCLESIRQMQREFPCELVIVDTGCDAKKREYIQQYADKIVDFDWIDDFSAGRNAGIAACSGEWIMIMDDDETIRDYGPLKEFFDSGEYRNYQAFETISYDYCNWEETVYSQSHIIRAAKNTPDLRYEGKIHEQMRGIAGPIKMVPAVMGHYGYIFDSPRERWNHATRNITIAEQGLAEHPEDLHLAMQLAQEYRVAGEKKKQEAHCKKYYAIARDTEGLQAAEWKNVLYCGWVDAVYANCDYDQTIALVERGLCQETLKENAKTYLYCVGCHNEYRRKRDAQCLAYGKKYVEYYDRYQEEVHATSAYFVVSTAYEDYQHQLITETMLLAAVRLGDCDAVQKYGPLFPWEDEEAGILDDLPTVLALAAGDEEKVTAAAQLLDFILENNRLSHYVIGELEQRDEEVIPLYLALPNPELVLPYLEDTSIRAMAQAGYDVARVFAQWPSWKKAKYDLHRALQGFLSEEGDFSLRTECLKEFVAVGWDYFPVKYTKMALEKEVFLTDEALLWKAAKEALTYVESGKEADAIRRMKGVMGLNSKYDEAIALWIHGFAEAAMKPQDVSEEMRLLGEQVKEQARACMRAGEMRAARDILLQLQGLLPNDAEIVSMLEQIGE